MLNFTPLLTRLQAAIAVVAARERALTVLLVAVWGRIGRIGARLERLIALWRAGKLPKPRGAVAGAACGTSRAALPTTPAWLLVAVREAAPFGARLEAMLSEAECAAFLAAVPQARRLLRPLCRMLGVGVKAPRAGRVRTVWQRPKSAPALVQASLVVGPSGRLMYV